MLKEACLAVGDGNLSPEAVLAGDFSAEVLESYREEAAGHTMAEAVASFNRVCRERGLSISLVIA